MGVPGQSMEIGKGIRLRGPIEHGLVRNVREGLIHDKDHVDILPQARLVPGLPGSGLGLAKAAGPVHGVGGELVAEAVGKAQLVEYGGDVIGVADVKGAVQTAAGVDRENQGDKDPKAGGGSQKPLE